MNYQINSFKSGQMELEEPYSDNFQYYSAPGGWFADRCTQGFYDLRDFESPRCKKPLYAFETFPHQNQNPCIDALVNDHKDSRLRSPEYEPWYPKHECQTQPSPTFQPMPLQEINRFENIAFESNDMFKSSPTKEFHNVEINHNVSVENQPNIGGFEEQNNTIPIQENEGVETASPHGSEWGGEDIWADVSHASFGNAQNVLDIGNSFSLNNDDEGEIIVDENNGLILKDLDEFSGIFDTPPKEDIEREREREEELQLFEQTEVRRPKKKTREISELDLSDELEGGCLEKKLKLERAEIKQKVHQAPPEQKDKWEKMPGKIMKAVKRGCQYYYTGDRGLKLECVIRVLNNKPIEYQKKFEKFIAAFRPAEETWEAIVTYVGEKGDGEIAYMLSELTYEFLSSREDLEFWMVNMTMSTKTKNYIRTTREIIKDTLIYYLYPRESYECY